MNGIILFPDGVTINNSEANAWGNINRTSPWNTKCTADQWTALAAKGCVFLPAAGFRDAYVVVNNAGSEGRYWASEPKDSQHACDWVFQSDWLAITNWSAFRWFGNSVRLVYDVE